MQKLCLYCWHTLTFEQSVQGQLFCSPEHRESYLQGQMLLNFDPVDDEPQLAGFIRSTPVVESQARYAQAASRILQSLESRKVRLPAMPTAVVPQPTLVAATTLELPVICPVKSESKRANPPRPAQLDPIVRFAARVGGFGPFKPQRSIRPWAISTMAAGLTLAALLWGPYWTGERSLVTHVSAAERPAVPLAQVGVCSTGKTHKIIMDGHPMGKIGAFEFPAATSMTDCSNRLTPTTPTWRNGL